MLEILKQYNYSPPGLKPYVGKNISVIKYETPNEWYQLNVNGHRWMTYEGLDHTQALELFSHYQLAKGHCVCTGMGFGSRENWLMQKKEVTKITIVEKNEELVEYHRYIDSPFLKECEIIIGDAAEIRGKCDTLLLDHYELERKQYIIDDVKKISNKVDCETLWFWPLEGIILNDKQSMENLFKNKFTYYQSYLEIKNKYNLSTLPNIDEQTLNLFCYLFYYSYFIDNQAYFNPPFWAGATDE